MIFITIQVKMIRWICLLWSHRSFFTRWITHICAPVFVFLSGVSIFLYSKEVSHDRKKMFRYLLTRGLFLIALEVTIINFAWDFFLPPIWIYLQVIFAIGLSMIILGFLLWLPYVVMLAMGLVIVFGHNLFLSHINIPPSSSWYFPWSLLYERSWVGFSEYLKLRVSYPLLGWLGIMILGYVSGRLFLPAINAVKRQHILLVSGLVMLVSFFILRYFNIYGETQDWVFTGYNIETLMSFINLTKYVPSAQFTLLMLGVGAILMWGFEKKQKQKPKSMVFLSVFGKEPLFFYIFCIYFLQILYQVILGVFGANYEDKYVFDHIIYNWIVSAAIILPCYIACKKYSSFKNKYDHKWLRYL